jgi:hypothetical protein
MTAAPFTVQLDDVLADLRAQLGQLAVDLATERAANAGRQRVIDDQARELVELRASQPAPSKPRG